MENTGMRDEARAVIETAIVLAGVPALLAFCHYARLACEWIAASL